MKKLMGALIIACFSALLGGASAFVLSPEKRLNRVLYEGTDTHWVYDSGAFYMMENRYHMAGASTLDAQGTQQTGLRIVSGSSLVAKKEAKYNASVQKAIQIAGDCWYVEYVSTAENVRNAAKVCNAASFWPTIESVKPVSVQW